MNIIKRFLNEGKEVESEEREYSDYEKEIHQYYNEKHQPSMNDEKEHVRITVQNHDREKEIHGNLFNKLSDFVSNNKVPKSLESSFKNLIKHHKKNMVPDPGIDFYRKQMENNLQESFLVEETDKDLFHLLQTYSPYIYDDKTQRDAEKVLNHFGKKIYSPKKTYKKSKPKDTYVDRNETGNRYGGNVFREAVEDEDPDADGSHGRKQSYGSEIYERRAVQRLHHLTGATNDISKTQQEYKNYVNGTGGIDKPVAHTDDKIHYNIASADHSAKIFLKGLKESHGLNPEDIAEVHHCAKEGDIESLGRKKGKVGPHEEISRPNHPHDLAVVTKDGDIIGASLKLGGNGAAGMKPSQVLKIMNGTGSNSAKKAEMDIHHAEGRKKVFNYLKSQGAEFKHNRKEINDDSHEFFRPGFHTSKAYENGVKPYSGNRIENHSQDVQDSLQKIKEETLGKSINSHMDAFNSHTPENKKAILQQQLRADHHTNLPYHYVNSDVVSHGHIKDYLNEHGNDPSHWFDHTKDHPFLEERKGWLNEEASKPWSEHPMMKNLRDAKDIKMVKHPTKKQWNFVDAHNNKPISSVGHRITEHGQGFSIDNHVHDDHKKKNGGDRPGQRWSTFQKKKLGITAPKKEPKIREPKIKKLSPRQEKINYHTGKVEEYGKNSKEYIRSKVENYNHDEHGDSYEKWSSNPQHGLRHATMLRGALRDAQDTHQKAAKNPNEKNVSDAEASSKEVDSRTKIAASQFAAYHKSQGIKESVIKRFAGSQLLRESKNKDIVDMLGKAGQADRYSTYRNHISKSAVQRAKEKTGGDLFVGNRNLDSLGFSNGRWHDEDAISTAERLKTDKHPDFKKETDKHVENQSKYLLDIHNKTKKHLETYDHPNYYKVTNEPPHPDETKNVMPSKHFPIEPATGKDGGMDADEEWRNSWRSDNKREDEHSKEDIAAQNHAYALSIGHYQYSNKNVDADDLHHNGPNFYPLRGYEDDPSEYETIHNHITKKAKEKINQTLGKNGKKLNDDWWNDDSHFNDPDHDPTHDNKHMSEYINKHMATGKKDDFYDTVQNMNDAHNRAAEHHEEFARGIVAGQMSGGDPGKAKDYSNKHSVSANKATKKFDDEIDRHIQGLHDHVVDKMGYSIYGKVNTKPQPTGTPPKFTKDNPPKASSQQTPDRLSSTYYGKGKGTYRESVIKRFVKTL